MFTNSHVYYYYYYFLIVKGMPLIQHYRILTSLGSVLEWLKGKFGIFDKGPHFQEFADARLMLANGSS